MRADRRQSCLLASESKLKCAWVPARTRAFPLARKRARGAGMTSVASAAIYHERGALQRSLSPHPRRMPKVSAPLPATGRGWAHPPSHVAAAGAWKESPDGSRSRRPAATVAAEAPAMAPVCSDRPEGSRCERRCSGNRTRREAKASQQDTNRRHAGAARQPRDPSRVSGSPTGFPGRLNRSLPGRVVPAPGLPMRHPRTRRTSRGVPRGGRRVHEAREWGLGVGSMSKETSDDHPQLPTRYSPLPISLPAYKVHP